MAASYHQSTYQVQDTVQVDTQDNEDHTFCGLMFPVKAKSILPVDKIVIRSISVRGQLGPITVWVTNRDVAADPATGRYRFRLLPEHWTKVYEERHEPSQRHYAKLALGDSAVVIPAGTVRAVYVHSKLNSDEAIVYDNAFPLQQAQLQQQQAVARGLDNRRIRNLPRVHVENPPRHDDCRIAVYSGKAHLSPSPFGQMPIWGWGNAWRDHREFVGQIEYGTVYRPWSADDHYRFGPKFQRAAVALASCRLHRDCPVRILPDECLFYVLKMCRWDWFGDSESRMKTNRRRYKRRQALLKNRKRARAELDEQQQQQEQEQEEAKEGDADKQEEEQPPTSRQRLNEPDGQQEGGAADAVTGRDNSGATAAAAAAAAAYDAEDEKDDEDKQEDDEEEEEQEQEEEKGGKGGKEGTQDNGKEGGGGNSKCDGDGQQKQQQSQQEQEAKTQEGSDAAVQGGGGGGGGGGEAAVADADAAAAQGGSGVEGGNDAAGAGDAANDNNNKNNNDNAAAAAEGQQQQREEEEGGAANGNNNEQQEQQQEQQQQQQQQQEERAESDESEWERNNGYRADVNYFEYQDETSDAPAESPAEDPPTEDEAAADAADNDNNADGNNNAAADEEDDGMTLLNERQEWFRRNFARIHILRSLGSGNGDGGGGGGGDAVEGGTVEAS